MGERTSHAPGTFSWTDLATTDAAGAKAFYGELFGWELEDLPVPDAPPYTMARIGGKAVCALYERAAKQPGPPAWLSYEAAKRFYTGLFGWRFDELPEAESADTDVAGQQYWGIFNGERLNGGMMPLSQAGPGAPPAWLVYFTTADLDASVARIGELQGQVLLAPTQIQSGRIAVAQDPQGTVFALFEGDVDD